MMRFQGAKSCVPSPYLKHCALSIGHLWYRVVLHFISAHSLNFTSFNIAHFRVVPLSVTQNQVTLCCSLVIKWNWAPIPILHLDTLSILSCRKKTEMMLSMASEFVSCEILCIENGFVNIFAIILLVQQYSNLTSPLKANMRQIWLRTSTRLFFISCLGAHKIYTGLIIFIDYSRLITPPNSL